MIFYVYLKRKKEVANYSTAKIHYTTITMNKEGAEYFIKKIK